MTRGSRRTPKPPTCRQFSKPTHPPPRLCLLCLQTGSSTFAPRPPRPRRCLSARSSLKSVSRRGQRTCPRRCRGRSPPAAPVEHPRFEAIPAAIQFESPARIRPEVEAPDEDQSGPVFPRAAPSVRRVRAEARRRKNRSTPERRRRASRFLHRRVRIRGSLASPAACGTQSRRWSRERRGRPVGAVGRHAADNGRLARRRWRVRAVAAGAVAVARGGVRATSQLAHAASTAISAVAVGAGACDPPARVSDVGRPDRRRGRCAAIVRAGGGALSAGGAGAGGRSGARSGASGRGEPRPGFGGGRDRAARGGAAAAGRWLPGGRHPRRPALGRGAARPRNGDGGVGVRRRRSAGGGRPHGGVSLRRGSRAPS